MGRSVTSSSESAFLTVPTSIGFDAGDLVYNQTGGYGRVSDTAVATATFPFGGDGTNTYQIGGNAQSQLTWVETGGLAQVTRNSAALLTNGNIVIPYAPNDTRANSSYPYFKIIDQSGNTVVAATQVDSTNKLAAVPVLGAIALPNGGFVVYYRATVSAVARIAFRVYNASGVAQTAVIVDTSFTVYTASASFSSTAASARSDSSFVLVAYNDSLSPVYRVYSSAGATVYSGTWGASPGNGYNMDVIVRSDDSWVMVHQQVNNFAYQIRSATNTSLAASTVSTAFSSGQFNLMLMSSDVVRLIGSSGLNIGTLTITGTTVSAESTLTTAGVTAYGVPFASKTKFAVIYNTSTQTGSTCYRVFNSDATPITVGSTLVDIPVRSSPGVATNMQYCALELSSVIRVFVPMRRLSSGDTSATGLLGAGVVSFDINKTSNLVTPAQSAVIPLGNTSSINVSGYARGASTPTAASFFATYSSVEQATPSAFQTVFSQTVVESTACDTTQVMGLATGGFAYLYKYSGSPYTIKVAIYNSSGLLQNTIVVDTGSSMRGGARMFTLNNGNIIVVYPKTTNAGTLADSIFFKRYSSTFTELASGTLVTDAYIQSGYSSPAGGFAVSPLGPDSRFVLLYRNFSNTRPRYAVFDSTGTQVTAADIGTTTGRGFSVCGSKNNTFTALFANNSGTGTQFLYTYYGNTATTYTALNNISPGNSAGSWFGVYQEAGPDSGMPVVVSNGTAAQYYYVNGGDLWTPTAASISNFGQSTNIGAHQYAVGRTASNVIILAGSDLPSLTAGQLYVSAYVWAPTSNSPTALTTAQNFALSCFPASSGGCCPSIAAFANDTCIISLLNTSGFPTFFGLYPYSYSQFTNITAGVSTSNPVTLSPASRFSLVGVAVSTAAAGAAGVIQTKGNAQLGSSYPSSTPYQPFDFRNQTAFGVAGSINGRILTLEN